MKSLTKSQLYSLYKFMLKFNEILFDTISGEFETQDLKCTVENETVVIKFKEDSK